LNQGRKLFHKLLLTYPDDAAASLLAKIFLAPHKTCTFLANWGSKKKSRHIDSAHYGIGNDLYRAMLGPTMGYTCGYWKEEKDLDAAQEAKFDLVCRKLQLEKGMHIADFGCGWGGFLKYAAEHYGVTGVGVTITENQVMFGNEMLRDLPVEIKNMDYRDITGKFDRVVSIGLMEHVGTRHHEV